MPTEDSGKSSQVESVCPACGEKFGCGVERGEESCWCFELPVRPDKMAELSKKYKGCVCEKCLRAPVLKS